ncbi:hypothetical protein [Nitrosomonas nitrosa]|uniref:hypothetical protein n=1 Tax=Nitrosomonas nitrosa TaxID=52442 RepID=UPI0023F8A621|nr:hypothetical protein [Nitrosomonas nitrosa]MCO6433035.1 hypothetical protein [Nitrosomonas nitrosa]
MAELIHQKPYRSFDMDINYEVKHHARKNTARAGKTLNAHTFSQQKNSLAFSFFIVLFFCFFASVENLL